MKKFIATLLLLVPLSALAVDDFGLNVPQWKDFAPTAYIDVKEPNGLMGKLNVTAKYWYERRMAFEEGLAECQLLENYEERFSCYENLKIQQFKQNSDYNARIEARMQNSIEMQQMNSINGNMLPLNNMMNNYTQFMPNELRGY